jgi:hypothetical protein
MVDPGTQARVPRVRKPRVVESGGPPPSDTVTLSWTRYAGKAHFIATGVLDGRARGDGEPAWLG